nr:hypothetical protein [Amycolatopsis sp. Hca4]
MAPTTRVTLGGKLVGVVAEFWQRVTDQPGERDHVVEGRVFVPDGDLGRDVVLQHSGLGGEQVAQRALVGERAGEGVEELRAARGGRLPELVEVTGVVELVGQCGGAAAFGQGRSRLVCEVGRQVRGPRYALERSEGAAAGRAGSQKDELGTVRM